MIKYALIGIQVCRKVGPDEFVNPYVDNIFELIQLDIEDQVIDFLKYDRVLKIKIDFILIYFFIQTCP